MRARALALRPDILCFDEPTSALDPELTGEVLRVIKEAYCGFCFCSRVGGVK